MQRWVQQLVIDKDLECKNLIQRLNLPYPLVQQLTHSIQTSIDYIRINR
jgi:hypothetical protein